jgi:flagellar protein FlaG
MIELTRNVHPVAPDAGSGARSTVAQPGVSQSNASTAEKPSSASGKVNTENGHKVHSEDVQAAVESLNERLKNLNVKREFSVEQQLNSLVVKLIDKEQGSVIKQIPSEDAIRLSKNVQEMMGLIFDETI